MGKSGEFAFVINKEAGGASLPTDARLGGFMFFVFNRERFRIPQRWESTDE
jgi:hypothetical protein